jgi:NAD(P)-dependent dehydrogenase (short-subunit alcohol dehydrogenase family)
MSLLTGKTALVTGGSSGIGFSTVQALRDGGARVVATASSEASAEKARAAFGDGVTVLAADAQDLSAMRALAADVGRLDIAVLNAGVSDWRPIEAWDEPGFDRVFDINVKATFFLLQALVPHLNNPSSVVITASNSAHGGFAGGTVYGASKAAVIAIARAAAVELLDRGIRVNTVSPGPTATPLFDKLGIPEEHHEAAMDAIAADIPAGRMGDPSEIAAAIAFLASDGGGFANGTDLVIDGGVTHLHRS